MTVSKLIIEIECDGKLCGACHQLGGYVFSETGRPDEFKTCGAWGGMVRNRERLAACLAAGEKFYAIERRYAELVEVTANRTDQAANLAPPTPEDESALALLNEAKHDAYLWRRKADLTEAVRKHDAEDAALARLRSRLGPAAQGDG